MSDYNDSPAEDYPAWLQAIAVAVDAMGAEQEGVDRFREMLGRWLAEHHSRDGPVIRLTDVRLTIGHAPRAVLEWDECGERRRRAVSLAEAYATLVAIHHVLCRQVKRIAPKGMYRKFKTIEQYKVSGPFAVLCGYVGELGDQHRQPVEGLLADVQADWRRSAELKPLLQRAEKRVRARLPKRTAGPRGAARTPLALNTVILDARTCAPVSVQSAEQSPDGRSAEVPARPKANIPTTPDTPGEPETPAKTYTVAALREMTGLENTALNRYAKDAKAKTPRRGERNFRYTARDAHTILETIISKTSERTLRAKCKAALRNLREMAE